MSLHTYATGRGSRIRAHPVTEPAPGDGGVVVVVPSDTWSSVDDLLADPRTDTTAAVLLAPTLRREGFMPNVVATASMVAPAVPADGLIAAVEASMEGADGWRLRARSVTACRGAGRCDYGAAATGDAAATADVDNADDDTGLTLDLVAEYRVGQVALALSSLVTARRVGGETVLWQTHVTTLADQLSHHGSGLAAARVRSPR